MDKEIGKKVLDDIARNGMKDIEGIKEPFTKMQALLTERKLILSENAKLRGLLERILILDKENLDYFNHRQKWLPLRGEIKEALK